MDNGTPALFRQGLSAGVRLAFFSGLALVLMLIDGKMHALDAFREAVGSYLISPAEALAENSRGVLASGARFFTTVDALTRENEDLKKKNAELSFSLLEFNRLKSENEQLQQLAGVKKSLPVASALGVIKGETEDAFSHKLEVNLGTNDGIEPGMPVMDEKGVLGQVTRVRSDECEITLLSDPALQFPVLLPRSGVRCATSASGDDRVVELLYVPAYSDIQEGDEVQTSGIDRIFPAHLPVGTVRKIERAEGDAFAHVQVTLAAEPSAGRYVMIGLVKNPYPSQSAVQEAGK